MPEENVPGEKSKTKEQNEVEERIAFLENQNKNLVKEAMEKKEQIHKLEQNRKIEEEKHLKEQNKYKELYESAIPKLERLNQLEPILTQMLDAEVMDIPEEKRDIIPQLQNIESKLLWLKNAKAKGLFSVVQQKEKGSEGDKFKRVNPFPSVQSKTQTDGNSPEFLSLSTSDPKFEKLSNDEYRQWKEHNRKKSTSIRGYGG